MAEGSTPEAFAWLDAQPAAEARAALRRCCGSGRWVERMLARRPFGSAAAMRRAARDAWAGLDRADTLEAFAHHPAIGDDLAALRAKFAETAAWSNDEQAGVALADERTLVELQAANREYRERFGYVFLVCATGKTAAEMLAALRARLPNDPDDELAIAAAELAKITELRLEKLGR
jgi:2-oxo-4-hydroxy-4-carboxy-5-ureidoimidazoline decarboxylase